MLRALSLLAVGVALVEGVRLRLEIGEIERKEESLEALATEVRRVAALKSFAPVKELEAKKETDLIEKVSSTLEASGSDRAALLSLSPEGVRTLDRSDLASNAKNVAIQSARIVLSGLDEPALGRFLAAWREREPLWRVSSIELVVTRDLRRTAGEDGGDPREGKTMRVTLVIEARYHREARS